MPDTRSPARHRHLHVVDAQSSSDLDGRLTLALEVLRDSATALDQLSGAGLEDLPGHQRRLLTALAAHHAELWTALARSVGDR